MDDLAQRTVRRRARSNAVVVAPWSRCRVQGAVFNDPGSRRRRVQAAACRLPESGASASDESTLTRSRSEGVASAAADASASEPTGESWSGCGASDSAGGGGRRVARFFTRWAASSVVGEIMGIFLNRSGPRRRQAETAARTHTRGTRGVGRGLGQPAAGGQHAAERARGAGRAWARVLNRRSSLWRLLGSWLAARSNVQHRVPLQVWASAAGVSVRRQTEPASDGRPESLAQPLWPGPDEDSQRHLGPTHRVHRPLGSTANRLPERAPGSLAVRAWSCAVRRVHDVRYA